MESHRDSWPAESHSAGAAPTREEAGAALEAAASARRRVGLRVEYPAGYLWGYAFVGVLLACSALGLAPASSAVNAVGALSAVTSAVIGGVLLQRFESRNGVRITGLRAGRRETLVWFAGILVVLAVAARGVVSGAWWTPLLLAPIGAWWTVRYARRWLVAYHQELR